MSARTPDAVAALHEAAREGTRVAYELHANKVGHQDPHKLMFTGAMHVVLALEKLADAPDPLAEAREIVGRAGWLSDDTRSIRVEDYDALRRALGMDVDDE